MSYAENIARYERVVRTAKLATTYLRKASACLRNDEAPPPDYWTLLDQAIETATEIVEQLPDDFFETTSGEDMFGILAALGERPGKFNLSDGPLEAAQKLVAVLEARRERAARLTRATRLEAVEGRTPEEAAMYLAKAEELRR